MSEPSPEAGRVSSQINPKSPNGKSEVLEHTPAMLPHLPGLDGLRAIAVSLVLWHHVPYLFDRCLPEPNTLNSGFSPEVLATGLHALPFWRWSLGGGLGVDLFFALSGFLITTILWRSRPRPHPLKTFWMRRVLRIQPLFYLYLSLLGLLVYGLGWIVPPEPMPQDWSAALLYGLYLGNVHLALNPEPSGLLVLLWSLAVEEQFYLIWPLLALRLSWRRMMQVCAGILLLTPWLRLLTAATLGLKAVRALPFTHADPLVLGAMLALLLEHPAYRAFTLRLCRRLAPVCGGLLGLYLLGPFNDPHQMSTGLVLFRYSIVGLLCTFLVGAVVSQSEDSVPGLLSRLLSHPVMQWLGRRSYGIYLWHWLVGEALLASLSRTGDSPAALALRVGAWGGLTLLVSGLSWRLFEAPILRLKARFEYGGR